MNQNENKTQKEIVEAASERVTIPAPSAPYWEGQTEEESLDISFNRFYTAQEWNQVFNRFTELLMSEDERTRKGALERIFRAISAENIQSYRQKDFSPVPATERLVPVLDAIAKQAQKYPGILDVFCEWADRLAYSDETVRQLILSWLNQLSENSSISINPDMMLAAKIHFGFYGTSWAEAGTKLLGNLDHSDLLVRACAANQISLLYCNAYNVDVNPQVPPIGEMMQLIRDREIERPGIAGCFWSAVTVCAPTEATEWMLDILEHSKEPEPFLTLFPCNLAFMAHERFSKDATVIRRLMKMGRFGIAIAAATEENYKIEEIEPILIELGYCEQPEITRQASWHLAYFYHQIHPRGEELGFVELISTLPEIDLFLLLDSHLKSPYAAIIYPKKDQRWLTTKRAWKWLNIIFPPSVRGEENHQYNFTGNLWYQRGYIDFRASDENARTKRWDNTIIGYRSDKIWHPKQLLELPS